RTTTGAPLYRDYSDKLLGNVGTTGRAILLEISARESRNSRLKNFGVSEIRRPSTCFHAQERARGVASCGTVGLAGASDQLENDGRFDREEATEDRSICEAHLPSPHPALKKLVQMPGTCAARGADAGQMRILTS